MDITCPEREAELGVDGVVGRRALVAPPHAAVVEEHRSERPRGARYHPRHYPGVSRPFQIAHASQNPPKPIINASTIYPR